MVVREGWLPIFVTSLAAAGITIRFGLAWSIPLWALVGLLTFLFRESTRTIPALPLAVVSPVDGQVIEVQQAEDPWLDRQALNIGIRMRLPGISTLRSPTEGKVMDFRTSAEACETTAGRCGGFMGNHMCYVVCIRTDEDDDVVFSLSTNKYFSRFKSDVAPGERIGQGQRNGIVYFGRRIDVLVPANSLPQVSPGDRVSAGTNVIAELVHS